MLRHRLPLVAALAVAVLSWPFARDVVRHHSYFAVHEVTVRASGRLDAEVIRAAAGIEPGTSIWDVDCTGVEARLARVPWVRSARVRRQLPDRVVLSVRQYRPSAILALVGTASPFYYVAANGRIFATVGTGDARDLPYLTGLREDDLGGREAFGPRAIRRALGLLRLVARDRQGLGEVSEVRIDRTRGLTLLPVRPTVPIELGWGQYEAKIGRLEEVLALWSGREGEVLGVSCLFDDQVIVRTRGPAPARKPQRATGA
jgi:cell division protein FtsQ